MKKLRPSNYWNIGKIESWLSDMSTKGFHLQTMRKNFCEFKKDEPRHDSYRIEIALDRNDLTREQHQKYNRTNWNYVTNFNKFHVFSCPYEIVTPEVNPYPEHYAEELKPVYKKTLLSILGISIGVFAVFKLFPYLLNDIIIVKALKGNGIDLASTLIIFFSFISLARGAYFQRRLIKALSTGTSIDHSAPWRNTYWITLCLWVLRTLIVTIILISSFPLIYTNSKPLSADDTDLPLVRLQTIEESDGSIFDKNLLNDNKYTKSWSVLAPHQYSCGEYIDTEEFLSTYVETETYKLIHQSLGKTIVNALVAEYDNIVDMNYTLEKPLSNDEFDILITRDIHVTKHVFAAKDGWVIHTAYYGEKKMDAVINAVAGKLKELSD